MIVRPVPEASGTNRSAEKEAPGGALPRVCPAPSTGTEACWFVAQLRPNCETIAKRNLERQGFGLFAPYEELVMRRASAYRTVRKPLFPGYLFVSFDPAGAHWRAINSTMGVSRLVSFRTGEPSNVPDALIANLQGRCDADGKILPPDELAPGEQVRIIQGPFSEFVATVEHLAPQQRIWVLLDVMGKSTRVVLKPGDLARTS